MALFRDDIVRTVTEIAHRKIGIPSAGSPPTWTCAASRAPTR